MLRFYMSCLVLFVLAYSGSLQAETYESVRHINTDEFASLYDHAIVIDSRSRLEYDVLHISNAVHIPASTMVAEDLQRLRGQYPHRPIIFYCNGSN